MPAVQNKTTKSLSGAGLKYIAMASMVLDHTASVFKFDETTADIFHCIGRLAFPIFCFLLVEGFQHTKDVRRYAFRLLAFAIISELPYDMFLFGTYRSGKGCNVMFTLFLGLIAMQAWKHFADDHRTVPNCFLAAFFAITLVILAEKMDTDYGGLGVAVILTMYIFRKRFPEKDVIPMGILLLTGPKEIWAMPAIGLFHLYNGKRGHQSKWVFYVFYPLHLLILGLISMRFPQL